MQNSNFNQRHNWLEEYSLAKCKFNGLSGLPVCATIDGQTGYAILTSDVDPRYSLPKKIKEEDVDNFFKAYAQKRFGKRVFLISSKNGYTPYTVSAYTFFNPNVFNLYNFNTIDTFNVTDIRFLSKYNILMTPGKRVTFYVFMGLMGFSLVLGLLLGLFVSVILFSVMGAAVFFLLCSICQFWTTDVSRNYYYYVRQAKHANLRNGIQAPYNAKSTVIYERMIKFFNSVYQRHEEQLYPYMMPRALYSKVSTYLPDGEFSNNNPQIPVSQPQYQYQNMEPQNFNVPEPVAYQPMPLISDNRNNDEMKKEEEGYYPAETITNNPDEFQKGDENAGLLPPSSMFF